MNRRIQLQPLLGLLVFVWFAGLVISYYAVHKPFTPELAVYLAVALARTLIALAIVSAAGGLGRRVNLAPALDPGTRLVLQAATGLGIFGVGWLLIGAAGGLRPLFGWGVLVVLLVILRRDVRAWLREWGALRQAWGELDRIGRLLAGLLAAALGLTLLIALAPPVVFDALVYHLTLPARYIDAGRFHYVPEIMYWGMPQTGEMVYTWGMLLGGERLPAILGWFVGLLALVGMFGLARRYLGAEAGIVAASVLASGYSLAFGLAWGYVDWLVILFGVCWLAALAQWTQAGERRELLWAGVFAGLALGTKYTAGILLICGSAVVLWTGRRSLSRAIPALLVYGSVALLVVLPWLLKNWIAAGSPVYPLLFPAGAMTPFRLSLYQGGAPFGGWQDVFLLPFRATFIGVEGGPGYSASIGPLFFGLGLCALLAGRALDALGRRLWRLSAMAAVTGVLAWMILGRFSSYLLQSRLYYAFFPALAVLAAAGFLGLKQNILPGVRLGRIAAALVLLVVGLNVFELGVQVVRMNALPAVLGLQSQTDYLENNLGLYAPAMQAVRELPPEARTLLLWEPRSFYCRPACDPDEVLDRWLRERHETDAAGLQSNDAILESWRAAGYTHMLYYRAGADFIREEGRMVSEPDDWTALEAMLARLTAVQQFGDFYSLYALEP